MSIKLTPQFVFFGYGTDDHFLFKTKQGYAENVLSHVLLIQSIYCLISGTIYSIFFQTSLILLFVSFYLARPKTKSFMNSYSPSCKKEEDDYQKDFMECTSKVTGKCFNILCGPSTEKLLHLLLWLATVLSKILVKCLHAAWTVENSYTLFIPSYPFRPCISCFPRNALTLCIFQN